MPKSFNEYAEERVVARVGSCVEFFTLYPKLVDEILLARQYPPATWKEIHAWLVTEYGYALKDPKGVADYMRSHA